MSQNHHPLFQELCGIVGEKYVRDSLMSRVTYSQEMSTNPPVISGVIVRPGSTEEISEIMKLANRTKCPVILRGGAQSANGVTKGVPNLNIVLDMGRLCEVSEIDVANQRAVFGGGIRPSQLDDALRPYGYFAHTVLGPYYTDSMGGLISGVSGAGYPKDMASSGLLWHHILGLKVVLPTGEVITTGAGPDSNTARDRIYHRCASSPDFTGLFMSGGGVFGIITEITMRIYKIPPILKSICYIFPEFDDMNGAQLALTETLPLPHTGLYATTADTLKMFGIAPPGEYEYCMMLSVEAYDEEDAELRMKRIDKICKEYKGVDAGPEAAYFASIGMTGKCTVVKQTSKQSFPFLSWECLYQRSEAKDLLFKLNAITQEDPEKNKEYHFGRVFYTIPIDNMMLVGVTMHWDTTNEEAGKFMLERWKKGAHLLNENGSCTTYTQGNNSKIIAEKWSPAYYNLMKNLKTMLDPNNILCPGLWNM